MLIASKPAKLILYLVCAAILGQTFTYFLTRYSTIIDAFFGSKPLLTALYVSYLTLVLAWSLVVLVGLNNKAIFGRFFNHILSVVLISSMALISVFHFIPVEEFQPLELIYVAYDMSIMAIIMVVLCWLIGKTNIGGVSNLKNKNETN